MSKLVGFGKFADLPEEQVGPAGAQAENVQSAIKRVISLPLRCRTKSPWQNSELLASCNQS